MNQCRRYVEMVLMGWILLAMSSTVSAVQYKSIKDPIGRSMQVPVNPERIVSLAPSVTEILFDLSLSTKVVGATRFSDYPEAALDLPKVGSYVRLDLERIADLQPDLCVGIRDGNPKTVVERLNQLGIPVFVVDPRDMASLMQTILAMGQLTGTEPRAREIVDDMQQRISRVKTQATRDNRRPRVFFQIGIAPIVSVGTHTFIHELITMAGGINVAAGPKAYPRFNTEQVIALAPDAMIITSMARKAVFEEVRAHWQQWPSIPAVRNKAIFLESSNLYDRPSPRLVTGLELLARKLQTVRHAIHP